MGRKSWLRTLPALPKSVVLAVAQWMGVPASKGFSTVQHPRTATGQESIRWLAPPVDSKPERKRTHPEHERMKMEPLELRINRSQRLVLASYPHGVVLEIQSATTLKDGHGWHVLGQVYLDHEQIRALHHYLTRLVQPPEQSAHEELHP